MSGVILCSHKEVNLGCLEVPDIPHPSQYDGFTTQEFLLDLRIHLSISRWCMTVRMSFVRYNPFLLVETLPDKSSDSR
jgi:hypothetical protein